MKHEPFFISCFMMRETRKYLHFSNFNVCRKLFKIKFIIYLKINLAKKIYKNIKKVNLRLAMVVNYPR